VAAPATQAATAHLGRAGGPPAAAPVTAEPEAPLASGRAAGTVTSGGEPGGGWLSGIAP
jgi:hypothetical protein